MLEGSQPSGSLNDRRASAVSADLILAEGHDDPATQMHDDNSDQAVDEGENADLSSAKDQLLRLSQ